MLFNPAEEAHAASRNTDGSINISKLLKHRNKFYKNSKMTNTTSTSSSSTSSSSTSSSSTSSASITSTASSTTSLPIFKSNSLKRKRQTSEPASIKIHGKNDTKSKAKRAFVFAEWLKETYGIETLQNGILDIAGGKGKLSIELMLATNGTVPCIVIDPAIRKRPIRSSDKRRFKKSKIAPPQFIHQEFNTTTFVNNHQSMLNKQALLVGLHPDQVTEDIVDVALALDKLFAVVPCCVFPQIFNERKLLNGDTVITLKQFIQYLIEKDPMKLSVASLNFEGSNTVVYVDPAKR